MTYRLTRRAALSALLTTPLAASAALAEVAIPASPPGSASTAGLRFRTVVVDATRVASLGNPTGADQLAIVLGHQMRTVFQDLMAPNAAGGATLVAKISSLYLTPYAGGGEFGGHNSSGSGSDSLDGIGIVTTGGRTVSETPILAVLDPGYSGSWYLPDIDRLRLESISYQFAWWLRREMAV